MDKTLLKDQEDLLTMMERGIRNNINQNNLKTPSEYYSTNSFFNMGDIRDILKIAKLINAEDTEDIKRPISIHQKYSKTGREYNN
jgi:hypothetical protein